MKNNRIVILGAGESGAGAAVLATKQGFEVFVSDAGAIKPEYKQFWIVTMYCMKKAVIR